MQRFAVIMAGGSGERFWPASRQFRPKQLLHLTDPGRSMLEEAILRVAPLIAPENVFVATSAALAPSIREALPRLPAANVIGEPAKRNTAACLALAAAELEHRHGAPERLAVAVLTADHMIGAPDRFRATMQAALDLACAEDVLVTIGVPPARPETGYGYIEVAEPIRPTDGVPPGRPVVCFREKPDLETARSYVASGRHLWNSGMFFWRVSTFLAGLEAHMPQLAAGYRDMLRAFEAKPGAPALAEVFGSLTDVSIDYGLMEKAKNVRVIPATFPWDDVGAWDALARSRARDAHGNVAPEEAILLDARDCIVHREGDGKERAIAVIGLSDVIVATTDDAVLVCHRDRAQDVRAVVAELKRRGRGHLT